MDTVTAPPDVVLRMRTGDELAHLFTQGPGWTRCRCRRVAWSAALVPAPAGTAVCTDCRAIDRAVRELEETGL